MGQGPARGMEAETEASGGRLCSGTEERSERASEGRQSPGRRQNRGSRLGDRRGEGPLGRVGPEFEVGTREVHSDVVRSSALGGGEEPGGSWETRPEGQWDTALLGSPAREHVPGALRLACLWTGHSWAEL